MIIAWTNFPFCPSFSPPPPLLPLSFPLFFLLLFPPPLSICVFDHHPTLLVLFLSTPVLGSLAYCSQPCILSCSGSSSRSGAPSYSGPRGPGAASSGAPTPNASRGAHHEPHPANSDGCHAAQRHPDPGAADTRRRADLHHPVRVPVRPGTYLPAGIPPRAQWGSR